MIREDLVSSAVSFLQDPSVAASTPDKRIAFLKSKNLTKEEIDISLARAGDAAPPLSASTPPSPPSQGSYGYSAPQMMRQPAYGYGPYSGQWGPPPEPPRRDWRDWFIMATVTSGVGYGMYVVAKRYVLPLISPPTPPQLEADKASIDASFSRAFTLIDQLTSDTAAIKESETARTEKLDTTLSSVNEVINDLKAATTRRENEARIIADQVQGLKEMVPKALEGWKGQEDKRVEELGNEVRSLRMLLQNRTGGCEGAQAPVSSGPSYQGYRGQLGAGEQERASGSSTPSLGGASASGTTETQDESAVAPAPGIHTPKREASSSRGFGSGKAAIPAWQMAAKSKSGEEGGLDGGA